MDISISGFPENLTAQQVTIASGASTSEVIATQGRALVGVIMPATWTAAKLAFLAGIASGGVVAVYDNAGNRLAATVAAAEFIAFPADQSIFAPYLQFASVDSTTLAALNQNQATILILLFRRFLS